jgi:hypothetical protein
MTLRLTRDDPHTIAFVIACVFAHAIDLDELRQWADHAIALAPVFPSREFPSWQVDLSSFADKPKDLFKAIGFVTSDPLTKKQLKALEGIGRARGKPAGDDATNEAAALKALAAHPEVRAEFLATFPFLADSLP